MTEEAEILNLMCTAPTEILLNIFCWLPVKDLMICRLVCVRWKSIVDRLARSQGYWLNVCRKDFNDYYWSAKFKANPKLSWFSLYRSITLWSKFANAVEECDEFALAHSVVDEVRNVEVLGNGIISVHRKSSIEYYNAETYTLAPRGRVFGDYAGYTENNSVIIFQTYQLHLFVIRKVHNTTSQEASATFDNVKMYLLADTDLYYVKLNDEIYYCDVTEGRNMKSRFIVKTEERDEVMSLGHSKGCLNVLTYQRNIYTFLNNKDFVFKQSITSESNILNVLYKYNFLEQLDWRVYFQWMYVLEHSVPDGPMRDIIAIRSYGDVFFVGTNLGVLRIFYRPFIDGEVNLFDSEPLTQINFAQRSDIPILTTCPILQIDVIETEKGHTVLVAMPKKVAVLNYKHNFIEPPFCEMSPYPSDTHYLQESSN